MKYQSRVSGPLLDRIDIQIEVPPVDPRRLPLLERGEPSAAIRARVAAARAMQAERYRGVDGVYTNAEAKSRDLADACRLSSGDCERLARAIERLGLSARAYDKVLRVARTCADLDGVAAVGEEHINAALRMRRLDGAENSYWI